MSQTFFIADNGKQRGPFTLDEMLNQKITRETLVWTEGLDNWTKAEHVSLLKDVLRSTPPPIPNTDQKSNTQQAPPPPIPESKPTGKYFGYQLARRRERFFASILESIIVWIPLTLIIGVNDSPYDPESILGWTIASVIFGAILYPIFSGNLGHKILGLKVISIVDGTDQNKAGAGALREGLKSVFGLVLIPLIWLLWDDDRQNLYDKVVKTIVVKKKQEQ